MFLVIESLGRIDDDVLVQERKILGTKSYNLFCTYKIGVEGYIFRFKKRSRILYIPLILISTCMDLDELRKFKLKFI